MPYFPYWQNRHDNFKIPLGNVFKSMQIQSISIIIVILVPFKNLSTYVIMPDISTMAHKSKTEM